MPSAAGTGLGEGTSDAATRTALTLGGERMRKGTFVGVMVVALAMILTAGGLLASNVGFKLNYQLKATGQPLPEGGTSKSGLNTIGLPFNPQVGMTNASGLRNDIGAANVQQVQRFVESSDGYQVYTGSKGETDWALLAGEGYFVKMGANVDYIIVGSHNPSFQVHLNNTGSEGSKSGLNLYSYPYHSTAPNASSLRNEIGAANVQQVQKFVRSSDGFQVYTGSKGETDFLLTPGEAYFIKMGTAVLTYVPSHY
jgi:hypothetical protein